MKILCQKVTFLLATLFIASCFGAESYLDNGVIKIGVELTKGGSITYLAPSGTTYNIINNYDLGRQVQQSYYSGPDNFLPTGATMHPSWTPWPWNPIQTGDIYGNRSLVLSNSNDGQTLYVKSRPMQWALNNVPGECTFESWITLNGNVATVSNRLVNFRTDTTQQFAARDQELPAVYTIGKLYKLVSYDGNAPFTGGAVTTFPTTPPPWLYWRATESWAALLNTTNWGLGVYYPGAVQFIGGFSGTINSGGPTSSSTGYMSPIYQEVIDSNIEYTYTYHLILGTLTEIRNWVYAQAYRPACDFVFDTDRRHWTFQQTTDAGWPLTNQCLRVSLNSSDPQMWSPPTVFYATNVPKLYLRAAYTIAHPAGRAYGQLFWETNSTGGLAEARSVQFPVVADGQYHTYELNLAAANNYSGLITRLRFDPAYNGEPGDFVDVKAISSNPCAGNEIGAPTGSAAQSFCSGSSPTVANLQAAGTGIQWYAAASGGSPLSSSTALTNGTHYYASQTVVGCESTSRLDVTATIQAQPCVVNGDFSDLTGMTDQGGGWFSGLPAGWSGTANDYAVNASLGTPPPVCNPSTLGTLKQNVGTFSNNTTVTLTFDVPQAFPNAGNLTARITDGTNVFAAGSFSAPATNQTLTTYVPAATPIYVEFVSTYLTPGLDNVTISVTPAPLTLVNGSFSDLSGLTANIASWFDGVPVHWSSTIASPAFTVRDPSGTNPVANLSTMGFLVQKVGVISNTADVVLTFDNNTTFAVSSALGVAILDGALTPIKYADFPVGLRQTLVATNVSAGTIINVQFWQVGGTLPGLDNVSMLLSATGTPTGIIRISGANVTLEWPTAYNGWVLETSPSLLLPNWTPVPGVINNSVTVTANSGSGFFRLRRTY